MDGAERPPSTMPPGNKVKGRQQIDPLGQLAEEEIRNLVIMLREVSGDVNSDVKLTLKEFGNIIPSLMKNDEEMVATWFRSANSDCSGVLTLDQYFIWALAVTTCMVASGVGTRSPIETIFRRYDKDSSGFLDELEFQRAAQDLGFGERAMALFSVLPHREDGTVNYVASLNTISHVSKGKAVRSFVKQLREYRKLQPKQSLDITGWTFTGDDPESARINLKALLEKNGASLSAVFKSMDSDRSNSLTQLEFKEALEDKLGFTGLPVVTMAIFHELDSDGSGKVGFAELDTWVTFGFKAGKGLVEKLSLTERIKDGDEWDGERLRKELSDLVKANEMSLTDLVLAWDQSGDNKIGKRELLNNVKKLVLDENKWYGCVRGAVNEAFQLMDQGGDGQIDLTELCAWLEGGDLNAIGTPKPPTTAPPMRRRPASSDSKAAVSPRKAKAPAHRGPPPLSPMSPLGKHRPPNHPSPMYCSKFSPWIEKALRDGEGSNLMRHQNANKLLDGSPRRAPKLRSVSSLETPRYDGTWRPPPAFTGMARMSFSQTAPIPSAAWCEEVVDEHIDASRIAFNKNKMVPYDWIVLLRSRRTRAALTGGFIQ